jgi:hypothetical protein
MQIAEIYTQYKIPSQLQLHMYRVSAVALMICEHMQIAVDSENVVKACLLHDMGNIIKFNMSLFPEFFEPEGVAYWQGVKDEFKRTYGNEEHTATYAIVEELGVSSRVKDLVHSVGFSLAPSNAEHSDYAKKICAYSDMRVTPQGVSLLEARLSEGKRRHELNNGVSSDRDDFKIKSLALGVVEKQIFEHCSLSPDEITDASVTSYLPLVKEYRI